MKHRLGPQTSGQAHPTTTPVARAAGATGIAQTTARYLPVPSALADVALIDASAAAAAGSMSLSWWHAEVAAGRAPKPVIQRPRCTRWRLADVHAFWLAFGDNSGDDAADALKQLATKASVAARAKRSSGAAKSTEAVA
ncbi:MAG: hypothetical protein JNL87_01340 [Burkholderiaceae bacterium]|nr:hypothetical protein [Burkholderiaceae bacterium]